MACSHYDDKQVCEKCNWCVEDKTYVYVFAEEEQMLNECYKTYDICKDNNK